MSFNFKNYKYILELSPFNLEKLWGLLGRKSKVINLLSFGMNHRLSFVMSSLLKSALVSLLHSEFLEERELVLNQHVVPDGMSHCTTHSTAFKYDFSSSPIYLCTF